MLRMGQEGSMEHDAHSLPLEVREVFRGLEVRPLSTGEQPLWDGLMQRHQYLGFEVTIGESLRYAAVHQERLLALLGWSSAALKCGVRDRWIGWTPALRLQRLHLLANNCRFSILPGVCVPHLASHILAVILRRLFGDWQRSHRHPIWIVEPLVDPELYRGTC